jgi:hypothetical protein
MQTLGQIFLIDQGAAQHCRCATLRTDRTVQENNFREQGLRFNVFHG